MPRIRPRRSSLRPSLESLEIRSLLSADGGMWPLRAADTTNSLLVKFSDGPTSRTAVTDLAILGARVASSFADGPSLVVLGQGIGLDAALARIRSLPGVVYAEPNADLHVQATPNDPQFASEWGLNQANNVDIDAPEAWDITKGSASTVVAVIDTGIDLTHPDLVGKVWTNTAEIDGNGIDDDQDGYIDDVRGWNFVANTKNPQDDQGHGTHVSGTIAASTNNAVGIAGVNWNARIMPLKFLDSSGSGSTWNAIRAIRYAADLGAKVINASWGGGGADSALSDAIAYAGTKGTIFVAAAGNNAGNNDLTPFYPASYRLSNTVSVAAVDSASNLASFSNYGANTVDVAAPGVNILSTYLGGGYAYLSGTSMAAPHVSGVLSLLAGQFPGDTPAQLITRLKAGVKPLTSLAGKTITGGIVSAFNSLGGTIITPPSSVKIIDDVGAGFSTVGAWTGYGGQGYLGGIHYAAAGNGSSAATWTFSVTPGARYRVSATWHPFSNRATNSPYTVLDGANSLGTTRLNQELVPSSFTDAGVGWQDLGTFTVSTSTLAVRLTNDADEYVIADGVRIELVGPPVSTPSAALFDGSTSLPNGTGTASFGSTVVGTPVSKTFTITNAGTANLVLSGPINLPAGFTLASGFGATTLIPGASTTFKVNLSAVAVGNYSGTVSFGTNDPSASTYSFNVNGAVNSSFVRIIDNNSSSGFSTVGTWYPFGSQGYLSGIHYAAAGNGSSAATWTFSVTPGARYRVSATWFAYSNRATNSPYTVLDGANSLGTTRLNQELVPSSFIDAGVGWQDLGTFTVSTSTLAVRLTNDADEYVIADAIRIEKV